MAGGRRQGPRRHLRARGATVYDRSSRSWTSSPPFAVIVVNAPIGFSTRRRRRAGATAGARSRDRARRLSTTRRRGRSSRAGSRGREQLDAVTQRCCRATAKSRPRCSPFRQRIVYEGHPELSFYQLNGDNPLRRSKSIEGPRGAPCDPGEADPGDRRCAGDRGRGSPLQAPLDAAALLWTARRV